MKQITLLLFCVSVLLTNAQTYFQEDFQVTTDLTAAGWTLYNDSNTPTSNPDYASIFTDAWNIVTWNSEAPNTVAATTSWFSPPGTADRWLITPAITLPAGTTPRVRFKIRSHDNGAFADGYILKVSTTGTAKADFTVDLLTVANAPNDLIANLPNTEVDLSAYAGQTIYLSWVNQFNDGNLLSVDDIVVDETPSCPPAANLTFDAFTDTTADISWDNAGDFTIEYGVFPYTQGGGGTTVNLTGVSSYQLTNLNPAISYDVFVTQNCGLSGGTSSSETITVGTRPSNVSTFPSTEDFEITPDQALILNLGVTRVQNTNPWNFSVDDLADGDTTNDFAFSGTNSFFSNNTFGAQDADATIFVGPYDLTTTNEYTFSVQQRNFEVEDATRPNKDIELIAAPTADGMNNTVLATFDEMNNITYMMRSGTFTPPTAGAYFFGVRDKSSFKTGITAGNSVFVDDFMVTAAPLSVSNVASLEVNAYYNNATGSLNYSSSSIVNEVEVYNMVGGLVNDFEVNDNEGSLNTDLKSGVYIASFTTQNGNQSIKFIVR
jgi:hypothetical protein